MFIPDPDLDFLPIPDPGVQKAPDPGSGSATLVIWVYIMCRLIGLMGSPGQITEVPLRNRVSVEARRLYFEEKAA